MLGRLKNTINKYVAEDENDDSSSRSTIATSIFSKAGSLFK
jgi:hypothetical protein